MTIPIYQADAFTDQLFGGNPAAVCPLTEWLPDETMQKIAAENNLAETAYFIKTIDGYSLRWFTPELEIDLCGHATLATAHILFTELGHAENVIRFETQKAGILTVTKEGDKYTLDFPSRPPQPIPLPMDVIAALGGKIPVEVLKSRDYFVVFETEEEVRNLQPDFSLLAKVDAIGVIATAEGDADDVDFVSRFFCPAVGIMEDPVTGSAHCNLIPYWAEMLEKDELHAYQISSRKGELWCTNKGDRILMSGKAVTYMRGEICIA